MTSAEIRQAFIDFFKSKDHTQVSSAPVVPQDDPTLLFTNAGMNQFKDVFLGTGTRDYSRAVDTQKCIRVSGKHNDLEEVGPSPNHHTFFEMLGNWSFGDYYKAEAIQWAWELMTEVYKLPKDKLYATVFREDDEAEQLWKKVTDINPSHISRHDEADNFWEMGDTGPCGPCSEIHLDMGAPAPGREPIENDGPNTESGRFVELWNLVFIQYHRDAQGELHDLPATHVDTGAGLERITRVMQDVPSNYETDLFRPLIDKIAEASGVNYVPPQQGGHEGQYIPHRAIADHVRMLSFAIADGALPGNEGRGYVLRRVLRRAARFIRELGIQGPFLPELVPVLIEVMGGHFTELRERRSHIETVLRAEEESFNRTLDKGIGEFNDLYRDLILKVIWRWKSSNKFKQLSKVLKQTMSVVNKKLRDEDRLILEGISSSMDTLSRLEAFDNWTNEIEWNNIKAEKEAEESAVFVDRHIDFLEKIYLGTDWQDVVLSAIREYYELKQNERLDGSAAFILYDTFGFPLDLTEQMARERGISVDTRGFHEEMERARERSRAGGTFKLDAGEFEIVSEGPHSRFTGYDSLVEETELRRVRRLADREEVQQKGEEALPESEEHTRPRYAVVLAETPFYAESGGQVADTGTLRGEGLVMRVVDVRQEGDMRVHYCEALELPDSVVTWPLEVEAEVDAVRRNRILPHHTTTHLLQAALRGLVGDHITQAGSRVTPELMTFDFTHPERLTPEQIRRVEDRVNQRIREDHPVRADVMGLDEAKQSGAMALFGEKYADEVRVITIGEDGGVSRELCGGTHLTRTGQAGLFRIESETAVSAGVRRVECTAGPAAWERVVAEREKLRRMTELVEARGSDPAEKLEKLLARQKEMGREIERLKKAALAGSVDFLRDWGREITLKGQQVLLVSGIYDAATDRDALQSAGDKIVADLKKADRSGIGIVGAELDNSFMIVTVVTPDLVKKGVHAGKLVGQVAKRAGGGGGGKPDFATAGSKDRQKAHTIMGDPAQLATLVEKFFSDQ